MDYFEFYNIPVSFQLDEGALRRTFYANSKKYHPDFFTLESEEKQAEILELSTYNNEAYQTLSNFDKRLKYILDIKKALAEEGQNKIPQAFLMEMMDINEGLMELEFDYDATQHDRLLKELEALEKDSYAVVAERIDSYEDSKASAADLEAIKDYYLKKRYLLRIRENLNKFAIQ